LLVPGNPRFYHTRSISSLNNEWGELKGSLTKVVTSYKLSGQDGLLPGVAIRDHPEKVLAKTL
jgi:hypothetical protein